MRTLRPALPLVVSLAVAAPLAAQDSPGLRFEIAPGATGVTRLDTQTGTVSHCTQVSGIWTCDPVASTSLQGTTSRGSASASIRTLAARMIERLVVVVHRLKHPHRPAPSTAAVS